MREFNAAYMFSKWNKKKSFVEIPLTVSHVLQETKLSLHNNLCLLEVVCALSGSAADKRIGKLQILILCMGRKRKSKR